MPMTCGRCHQSVRDTSQHYDQAANTITLRGTCGCGTQEHKINLPPAARMNSTPAGIVTGDGF